MDIAIIGSRQRRQGARKLARARRPQRHLCRRDIRSTRPRPPAIIGARAAGSNSEAVDAADLVILAVPAGRPRRPSPGRSATRRQARSSSTSPTVRPRTRQVASTSLAEELQAQLPGQQGRQGIQHRASPPARRTRPSSGIAADGFVAGDDAAAKQTVLDVVESIGFRPVDAGSLAAARTLEGMAWLNISRALAGGSWQDAWVLVGPDAALRLVAELTATRH